MNETTEILNDNEIVPFDNEIVLFALHLELLTSQKCSDGISAMPSTLSLDSFKISSCSLQTIRKRSI